MAALAIINIGKVLFAHQKLVFNPMFGKIRNLVSSTWQVKIDGLGILEGETYQENYQEVVKFLGVPYAETPKRFEHSQMKTDLGFFEAKSFSLGPNAGITRPFRPEITPLMAIFWTNFKP